MESEPREGPPAAAEDAELQALDRSAGAVTSPEVETRDRPPGGVASTKVET
ncbi:hypothetical protein [Lentzea sp. NPDC059081]|uniref:hypothetical protein n=1 Tax=Lentzea sp. NPDC059081 TaxID=3346719 RepID=UPI0036BEB3F9